MVPRKLNDTVDSLIVGRGATIIDGGASRALKSIFKY